MSTFIIAEIGNSHEGSLELARCFIKAAANCGVDAVKFQTHIFEAESLADAPNPPYFKNETRKDYLERTAFNHEQYKELREYAEKDCRTEFMASPFSLEAVDFLEQAGLKRYKIPSGEVTNLPLLEKVARTQKPVLLSSGMSTWNELDAAIETLKNNGCNDIVVCQCTSVYPCPPEKVGLNIIEEMRDRYNLPVGFSDHTLGFSSSIGAVISGAKVIEKHFTLSRKMYGSDVKHSMEPDEFKLYVQEIRDIEKVISSKVDKDELSKELSEMKLIFEKSIVAEEEILKGTVITFDMICFKKPGDGIRADRYKEVIGRPARVDITRNTKIQERMLG